MAQRPTGSSGSATNSAANSAGNSLLSPVTKYNKMREDELLAQQERLNSVRVDRKSTPSVAGKRKLDAAIASESAAVARDRTSPAATFIDAAAPSSVAAARANSATSKAVALTAALAKKKQRRSAPTVSTSSSSSFSTNSSSAHRRRSPSSSSSAATAAAGGKSSISGIMKNYMKKVEEKRESPAAAATTTTTKAAKEPAMTTRPLGYDAMTQQLANSKATTKLESPEMFRRAVDASMPYSRSSRHLPPPTTSDTTTNANAVPLRTPKRTSRLTIDPVEDLQHIADVASLETVEGTGILDALRSNATPRAGRTFPSERTTNNSNHSATKGSNSPFQVRRDVALRSKYTPNRSIESTKAPPATNDPWAYTEQADGTVVIARKAAAGTAGTTRDVVAHKLQVDDDNDDVSAAAAEEDEAEDEPDAVNDANEPRAIAASENTTTDRRIRIRTPTRWRIGLPSLAAVAVSIAVAVAWPLLLPLATPHRLFCDSDAQMTLVDSTHSVDRSVALAPYRAAAVVVDDANVSSTTSCRPCPVFGLCANGEFKACIAPYERVADACNEPLGVHTDVQLVAAVIYDRVVATARQQLQNQTLYDALIGVDTSTTAPLQTIDVAELLEYVSHTIAFAKAIAKLPREYVLTRALELALRDLHDVVVAPTNDVLLIGRRTAPWHVQLQHVVVANARLLAAIVLTLALLARIVRFVVVKRIERAYVDRFVNEVRFALLQRTSKRDKAVVATHLRDDLLDLVVDVAPQDRLWLCDAVWPRVVALVEADSRVRSSTKTVSKQQMVMWEWIPVSSPTNAKAPTTLAAAKHALMNLAGRRRKDTKAAKATRKSFPL